MRPRCGSKARHVGNACSWPRPGLLTHAAYGGLQPAPASRLRGAVPHVSRRLLRHTFVHPPRAVGPPQMRPDPLLQLSRIGLDTAEDGGVSIRDAAVLQHEREVA